MKEVIIPEIEALREIYYLNFYIGKHDNAPILDLVLVDKKTGAKVAKYPIWRDKTKDWAAYMGKGQEPFTAQERKPVAQDLYAPRAQDDMADDIPF